MAFGLSKSRFSPIAIDYGADSLKLLQIISTDPPQLVAASAVPIPSEVRFNIALRNDFLGPALQEGLRKAPFKGRRAILSIPAFQTLIQHLVIAQGNQEALKGQVELQLRERLNVDPSRMVIRHFSIGQIMRDGSAQEQVICLAARRDTVMTYIDLANRSRLDVIGMHSEPVAMLRAFDHLFTNSGNSRTMCFVDIGAAVTKVVIAHGVQMVFAKTIQAGGDHMTRELATNHQMDFAEAQQVRVANVASRTHKPKEFVGLAKMHPYGAVASDHKDRRNETIECIIDELQLCLRYHRSLFPEQQIEKLVFLGGEARDVQTCQAIARSVRVAAQVGDPFARVSRLGHHKSAVGVNLNEPQPGWAVPLGLCFSEANL